MTVSPSIQYEKYVKEGTALVVNYNQTRFKIADLASKACMRSHSKHTHNNDIPIKQFAEDIGVNYKVLCRWIRLYEIVYVKLSKAQKAEVNKGGQIEKVISIATQVNNNTSKKDVQKIYKKGPNMEKRIKGVTDKIKDFNRYILENDLDNEAKDSLVLFKRTAKKALALR